MRMSSSRSSNGFEEADGNNQHQGIGGAEVRSLG
jgi:hypothetical protein